MKLLLYFVILFVGNSVLLFLCDSWGLLQIEQAFGTYFLVTLILSALHTILKPILKILTFPFFILTFGLFSIVINALLLWLTAYVVSGFEVFGLLPLLYATILLSLFHAFVHSLLMSR